MKNSNRRQRLIFLLLIMLVLAAAAVAVSQTNLLFLLNKTDQDIIWTTENEIDTIGYNLYRADSAEGEFIQINDHLIPTALDPTVNTEHVFTDKDLQRGRTYWYILETVTRSGQTEREGPIPIKVK